MTGTLHTVLETGAFIARSAKLMTDADRVALVDLLADNPLAGALIKGTRGLRKVRVGLEGRGKRGGARVIYW